MGVVNENQDINVSYDLDTRAANAFDRLAQFMNTTPHDILSMALWSYEWAIYQIDTGTNVNLSSEQLKEKFILGGEGYTPIILGDPRVLDGKVYREWLIAYNADSYHRVNEFSSKLKLKLNQTIGNAIGFYDSLIVQKTIINGSLDLTVSELKELTGYNGLKL
jgi:hypothetical protein